MPLLLPEVPAKVSSNACPGRPLAAEHVCLLHVRPLGTLLNGALPLEFRPDQIELPPVTVTFGSGLLFLISLGSSLVWSSWTNTYIN